MGTRATCLTQYTRPVADVVPVVFGEDYNNSCGSTTTAQIVNWADQNGVGYEAWAWNTWGQCSDLIARFDGTVAPSSYARWIHDHYVGLP